MKRTVCAVDEGISAQEPDAKRSKVEEDESEKVLQLDVQDFECVICADLIVDPVVGRCGHDFCKGCLEDWIYRNKHKPHCPVCRTYLGSSQEEHGVCLRLKELVEKLYPRRSKDRRREVEKQTVELKRRRKQEEQQQRREQEQRIAAYAAAGGQGYGYGFHMSGRHMQEELRRMRSQLEGAYTESFRELEHQALNARRGTAAAAAWGPAEAGVAPNRGEIPTAQTQHAIRTRRGTAAAAAAAAARGAVRPGAGAAAGRGQARQDPASVWFAAHRDAGAAAAAAGGAAGRTAVPHAGGRQGEQLGQGLDHESMPLAQRMARLAQARRSANLIASDVQHRLAVNSPQQRQQQLLQLYEQGVQRAPQLRQFREQQVQQGEQRMQRHEQHMREFDHPWHLYRDTLYDRQDASPSATGPASHDARDATTQVDAVAAAPSAAAAAAAAAGVDRSRQHREAGQTTAAAAAGLEAVPPVTRLQADDFDAWVTEFSWDALGMNDSPADRDVVQVPGGGTLLTARPLSSAAAGAAAVAPRDAAAAQLPAAALVEPAVAGDTAELDRAFDEAMAQHTQARPGVAGPRAGAAAAPGRASGTPRDPAGAIMPWQTNPPGVPPEHSGDTDDNLPLFACLEDTLNPAAQIRAPALPSDAAVVAAAAASDDDADSGCRRAGGDTADSNRRRTVQNQPLSFRAMARLNTQAAAVAAAQARLRSRQNERAGLRRALRLRAQPLGARSSAAAAGAEDTATAAEPALLTSPAAGAARTGADPAADSVAAGATAARAMLASAAGADADRVELATGWGATYPRSHRDRWMMRDIVDWCPTPSRLPPPPPPPPNLDGLVDVAAYLDLERWPHSEREAQEVAHEVLGAAGEPPAAAAVRAAAGRALTGAERARAAAAAERAAAAGQAAAAGDRDRVHASGGQVAVKRERPTASGSDSDESPVRPPTAAAATAAATADDMPGQQQQRRVGLCNRASDDNTRRRGAFLDMMSSRPAGWFLSAAGAARPSGAEIQRARFLRALSSSAAAGTAPDTPPSTATAAAIGRNDGLLQRPRRMAYMLPTPQGHITDPGVSDTDPSDAEGSNRPAQAPEAAEPRPPAAGDGGGTSHVAAVPAAGRQDTTRAHARLQRIRGRSRMDNIHRQSQRTSRENQPRRADLAPAPSGGLVPPTAAAAAVLAPAESAELAEEVARATARHVRREVEGLLTGSLPRRHAARPGSGAVVVDGGYVSSSSDQE